MGYGYNDPRNPRFQNQQPTSGGVTSGAINPETGSSARSTSVSGTPGWASQTQDDGGAVRGASYADDPESYSGDQSRFQQGLTPVAPAWDPISGDWYYVRAESIDGQAALQDPFAVANRPGTPLPTQLDYAGVEHVPVLGANGPQADGTWLNQQQVREQQQVLSGTTMETNFPRPGSTPGIVEPPEREAPPAPAAPRPQYATPSTGTPKLDASPNTGGQRATGLVAGQRGGLDVFLSPDSPGASVAGLTIKPRR